MGVTARDADASTLGVSVMSNVAFKSVLENEVGLPLYAEQMVRELGRITVVAPHPDDESLGCGGLLALAAKYQQACAVIFVSDGAASHPNSVRYPPNVIAKIRKREALTAIQTLGLNSTDAIFMNVPDGKVPSFKMPHYADVMTNLYHHLRRQLPDTIIVPWRRDPHCDHQATHELASDAALQLPYSPRILEYPIWARVDQSNGNAPKPKEMNAWRIDTTSVQHIKLRAISAHQSQLNKIIDDDPEGFQLKPQMLKSLKCHLTAR